ncbi:hypothetical protein GCM10023176_15430 [Micromonospora coerulea]|uniref:Uncharacterized protein n=1 Tax=Micromonospora coerulea TaxID=47856 RepID=A0ABP8SED5_9ACTN
MATDAVAGNALRVAPAQPGATDDPVLGVLAAFTKDLIKGVDETLGAFLAAGGRDVARLAEVVADTGAVARVERMISGRVAEALTALDTASIDETARTALTGLATAASTRRA